MRKLVTVFMSVLLLLSFASKPAFAAPLRGCPDDYVCLYQWINFGADRWQSSFYNLSIHSNQCVNLTSPMAYWDNGTPVTDNSGSMVVNATGAYGTGVTIEFYNWVNCNPNGGFGFFSAHVDREYPDLSSYQFSTGITAYHTITSIGIRG